MYGRSWGRVVTISSAHGLRASPFKAAYVCAKHGLEGLSKVIALEGTAHGVTSNCINPAYVRTALVEKQIADQARTHGIDEDTVIEQIMLTPVAVKRLIDPAEVAAVLYEPASSSITGSSLTMDGALTKSVEALGTDLLQRGRVFGAGTRREPEPAAAAESEARAR